MNLAQRLAAAGTAAALLSAAVVVPAQAAPGGDAVVINEAYTNGGSANAVFTHKFVELHNPTNSPISLDGWSLQYRSSGGEAAPTGVVTLSGSIPAKGYYLIQGNSNGSNGEALPTADATTGASFSGTKGTLVLSNQAVALDGLATGSVTAGADSRVVDLLGYGATNTFETAAAASPTGNADPKSMNRLRGHGHGRQLRGLRPVRDRHPDERRRRRRPGRPSRSRNRSRQPEPTEVTPIAEIQGTGPASDLADGTVVKTQGVVTAVYSTGGFNGYYLQTEGTGGDDDATPGASDAIFVFSEGHGGQGRHRRPRPGHRRGVRVLHRHPIDRGRRRPGEAR